MVPKKKSATGEDRVAVILTPRGGVERNALATQLSKLGTNPKLRIDNVRKEKTMALIIVHCKRRWTQALEHLGGPELLLHAGPEPSSSIESMLTVADLGPHLHKAADGRWRCKKPLTQAGPGGRRA